MKEKRSQELNNYTLSSLMKACLPTYKKEKRRWKRKKKKAEIREERKRVEERESVCVRERECVCV